jgi:hypothetical protein
MESMPGYFFTDSFFLMTNFTDKVAYIELSDTSEIFLIMIAHGLAICD